MHQICHRHHKIRRELPAVAGFHSFGEGIGDEPVCLFAVAQRIAVVTVPDDPLDRCLDRRGNGEIHVRDEGGYHVAIVLVPFGVTARLQRGLAKFEADRLGAGHDIVSRRFHVIDWEDGVERLGEMAGDRVAIGEFSQGGVVGFAPLDCHGATRPEPAS